ncbi:phosphomannomutase/phosphoglucomutase [Maridesulfovibrio hydrothermalis]|uniref:Phosphomannomutase/phosphoglucomutase n=1 Tax=Maridesulfovibrio hydrothermalis AM13 = DSM 14728 TaxID=1121451 RepID=L0R7Y1_9BACT|nr:phosphomannomutase/phosphoglucomutase [Maridesulfovibrio hydrothermalis]CCO22848.1 Phosphomannomutase/phosphoglucomutase [Maridesulfovibrio hydrothermalis AM13 = DSM 14728]
MKDINSEIFRAYDIRGIVGQDFDEEWVENLGRSCGTWFLSKGWNRAVVGHDCRHSSPAYQAAITRGLNASGVDVLFLNLVPSPVLYFAARKLNYKAGVMITASHNPPEFNGFKIWGNDTTIHTDDIQQICQIMKSGNFAEGSGIASHHDIVPYYIEDLLSGIKIKRPVKIVLDGGNGAGGHIALKLLRQAGAEVIPLYCTPDGDFPNHHPDPVVEAYMGDLLKAVVEHGAEAGIGLDGDADRIGAVDENGRLMPGDRLLAIYAREMLSRKPGETVVADVKCSHLLFEDIEKHGGRQIMARTGHSIMKAKMAETGAGLGGEMSGHIFFADRFYGFDDGIYSALRLIEILAHEKQPLSKMLSDWPETFFTPELRIDCPEKIKFELVEKAAQRLAEEYNVIDIDGVRVVFEDGWALVRASNTQAALTLRFEASSAKRMEEIKGIIESLLDKLTHELTG